MFRPDIYMLRMEKGGNLWRYLIFLGCASGDAVCLPGLSLGVFSFSSGLRCTANFLTAEPLPPPDSYYYFRPKIMSTNNLLQFLSDA